MERLTVDEYFQKMALEMRERGPGGLQERVRRLCKGLQLGVLFYHTYDSRKSAAGYPDCHIVIPCHQRSIFVELKTEDGDLSPQQMEWLDALSIVPGAEVYLWRPTHLLSGSVRRVLMTRFERERDPDNVTGRWRPPGYGRDDGGRQRP